jgi:uncharacterized 2Fe-2S/4Fe-4S cluster protein (DUF4445 family)
MRAAPGAIHRVHFENGALQLETIDAVDPVGICGSGVVSLMAELWRTGAVDRRGRLSLDHPLVRESSRQREFLIAEGKENALPIVFTQEDIRAVQLAKAAIRTGMDLLLEVAGVSEDRVERFLIAGAFGRFLELPAAMAIGLLPNVDSCRMAQVGNAAGAGVRRMLVCAQAREKAKQLARQAQYLELATQPEFHRRFAQRALFE